MSSKCYVPRGKVDYSFLILCDDHFFRWLKSSDRKSSTLSKLMKIKATSFRFNGRHNMILTKQFDTITKELPEHFIRAAVSPEDSNFVAEEGDNDYSIHIKYASHVSSKNSIPVVILTDGDKKDMYISNEHFKDLGGEVTIYAEEDAVKMVNRLFREFEIMIESNRTGFKL